MLFLTYASMFLVMQGVQADTSWQVSQGQNGTRKIATSNGTYIEESEDGFHWLGTEDEYNHKEAVSRMESLGYKEFPIKGARKNGPINFVYDWLPEAWVGSVHLGEIESYIYFEFTPNKETHPPPKPEGSRYVEIAWTQSEKANVRVQIIDTENHKSYSTFYCEDFPESKRHCFFLVQEESLGHQSNLIFSLGNKKPVEVENSSIARQMNKFILHIYKPEDGKRDPLAPVHATMLNYLHAIDNGIATTLPPLPNEAAAAPLQNGGCSQTQQALTADQFKAIKTGEKLERLQCLYGAGTQQNSKLHELEYYWKMTNGNYALIYFNKDQRTVMAKAFSQSLPN